MQHVGGCQVQREARAAQRYRISSDELYAEAIKQIGRTTVQKDGSYMGMSL